MTRHRYAVVLLMFLAVFVNYMDRVNFSVAIPKIRDAYGFSLEQIGAISFAWAIIYALCNFPGGWLADRLGLRLALPLLLGWWSAFTIATPFARSLSGWFIIRGLMGAGEAPIWPINAKTTNTWAAPSERSTFFTLAGCGQYAGPAIGTLLAGWIVVTMDWQWTFILFGIAGLAIVPLWLIFVRDRPEDDPRTNEAERAWIGNRSRADQQIDWPGIRAVLLSRTGLGMLLVYLTFGYILFTFINWVPSYMFYTFHMSILKSAAWASLGAVFGLAGFLISGPFNDRLVARFDRLTARRIGATVPMLGMIVCVLLSLATARAEFGEATAILIGLAQLLMNMTVGAWAVNVVEISPNQASTAIVYSVYNGVLNIMGAFNSLILTALATAYGFPLAFGSALFFMLVFLFGMLLVVDRKSYTRLIARAEAARAS
ncbi:MAG TPA: MFS transporter [Candidatus Acidoferrum sp.]|jgi:sugar phosphate permease|nr:MFS transporter [Candidatus Acidoferrum sp.]